MPSAAAATTPPTPDAAVAAAQAVTRIKDYLSHHAEATSITLAADGDDGPLVLPREAVELLTRVLVHMASGEGVSIVPAHAELTTQQAADLLNVSRPYLIKLLEAGEIEHRLVGKHRRIPASALQGYRRSDGQRRREAADELSALTQELGFS